MENEDTFKVDFIGVGDQKAASTWIYQCLSEHPEIDTAKTKELLITKTFLPIATQTKCWANIHPDTYTAPWLRKE